MKLYILRHGIAVEAGMPGRGNDSERRLTREGKQKVARIARVMRDMKLSFDLILASPLVRARQTAEIVAKSFRAQRRLEFTDALAVGGDPRVLIREINRRRVAPDSVLLVGHEPYLSGLISMLIGGTPNIALKLKKAGLCHVSLAELKYGRCGSIEWLLTPRQMLR